MEDVRRESSDRWQELHEGAKHWEEWEAVKVIEDIKNLYQIRKLITREWAKQKYRRKPTVINLKKNL
jgi:hypothetical protein